METTESRGLVFNKARETRNMVRHTASNQRKIPRENATGTTGLKSTAIPKNPAAHKRCLSRIACTNTSPAPAHTMNCTAILNSTEECQEKTATIKATTEAHFMISVNMRTSIL